MAVVFEEGWIGSAGYILHARVHSRGSQGVLAVD
jgi:hypothetical protein